MEQNAPSAPFISFCIPTWNRASSLGKALGSIVSQVGTEQVEVIISDNGSTDDTGKVVATFKEKYDFVKYNRNESNMGFDRNVLSCMYLSSGKYIHFLADEDMMLEGGLSIVIQSLKENNVSCAFSNFYEYYTSLKTKGPLCKNVSKDVLFHDKNSFLNFLSINSVWMSGIILNREEALRINPQQFIGTTFMHWCTLMSVLNNHEESLFIARPSVASIITPTPARYNMINEMILLDNLLSYFKTCGYGARSIIRARLDIFVVLLKNVLAYRVRLTSAEFDHFADKLKLYTFPLLPILSLVRAIPLAPLMSLRRLRKGRYGWILRKIL